MRRNDREIRDMSEIFDALHMGTKKVMAVGGGTKNMAWLQAVSDISNKRQHVAQVAEQIKLRYTVEPDPEAYEAYAPFRSRYNRLYLQTKDMMDEF